jgi:hypothetical protein
MITRSFSLLSFVGALIATLFTGCEGGLESEPVKYEARVSSLVRKGWSAFATNDSIVIRRKEPVWTMSKVGGPAPYPDRSVESYFKEFSKPVVYEVQLRFVPKLSPQEMEKLKEVRSEAAANLIKGAKSKSDYGEMMRRYWAAKVPRYFSASSSIYVDLHYEPKFTAVYPPEAAMEMERLINSLGAVFGEYDGMKALEF